MPLQRRVPKFGFKNRFRTEYRPINVSTLNELASSGRIDASAPVTPEVLISVGLVGKKDLIKILGGGTLDTALSITAHAFSTSAKEKIEGAGGSVNVL